MPRGRNKKKKQYRWEAVEPPKYVDQSMLSSENGGLNYSPFKYDRIKSQHNNNNAPSHTKIKIGNITNLDEIQKQQSILQQFQEQLKPLGLRIRTVTNDKNSLFRAISDQLYGHESNHFQYRQEIVEYMRQNSDEFIPFYLGNFKAYLKKMSKDNRPGGNMELTACSKRYKCDIIIHNLNAAKMEILFEGKAEKRIQLSFIRNKNAYSSVRSMADMNSLLPVTQEIDDNVAVERFAIGLEDEKQIVGEGAFVQGKDLTLTLVQETVMARTGCYDLEKVIAALEFVDGDIEKAVKDIMEEDRWIICQCGHRNEPDWMFCSNCGWNLEYKPLPPDEGLEDKDEVKTVEKLKKMLEIDAKTDDVDFVNLSANKDVNDKEDGKMEGDDAIKVSSDEKVNDDEKEEIKEVLDVNGNMDKVDDIKQNEVEKKIEDKKTDLDLIPLKVEDENKKNEDEKKDKIESPRQKRNLCRCGSGKTYRKCCRKYDQFNNKRKLTRLKSEEWTCECTLINHSLTRICAACGRSKDKAIVKENTNNWIQTSVPSPSSRRANAKCGCGSGKRYRRCCKKKHQTENQHKLVLNDTLNTNNGNLYDDRRLDQIDMKKELNQVIEEIEEEMNHYKGDRIQRIQKLVELNKLKTQRDNLKKNKEEQEIKDELTDEVKEDVVDDKDQIIEDLKNEMDKLRKEIERLRKENKKLKVDDDIHKTKGNECVICMDGSRLYACIPCGHLCLCSKCMKLDLNDSCPVCGKEYQSLIRIYT